MAEALEYQIGEKGGVYCLDDDTLLSAMKASLAEGQKSFPPSCGSLPSGTSGQLQSLTRLETLVKGVMVVPSINNGKPISFLSVESDASPASPTVPREPIKPSSVDTSRSYKIVSPDDVLATPSKWTYRDIEFQNVHVYWVSYDDVRIITSTAVTLFATDVKGESKDLDYWRENCETVREALSRQCLVNARFKYSQHGEDTPTGVLKRVVLKSDDVTLIRTGRKKR